MMSLQRDARELVTRLLTTTHFPVTPAFEGHRAHQGRLQSVSPMDYAGLQARAKLDLGRRVETLKADYSAWTAEARATALGLGPRQRTALGDMLAILDDKQRAALKQLDAPAAPLTPAGFADAQATLLIEMTGAQELWRVFRFMLGQLEDPFLQGPLKAAGRIAADCYTIGIQRARAIKAIEPHAFREAPLVYLEAVESPATAGRADRMQDLNASVRQWRNLKLPLPIVLLPVDYAHAIWTYCALHHEVGHNLDQDLGLRAEIRGGLIDVVAADQETHWRRWSGEMLADVLGIVLGGVGFALSLGALALLLGPAARYNDLDPDAEHPPLLLRVRLLAAFLRRTGVAAHAPYADQLDAIWNAAPRQAWLQPYADGVGAVAALFVGPSLEALKQHPITDLNNQMDADHAQVEALASYLLTGKKRPDPLAPAMRPRLVASAAQLAVWNGTPADAAALQAIHTAALDYLDLVPAVTTLAAEPGRREYLQKLARDIDFGKLRRREV